MQGAADHVPDQRRVYHADCTGIGSNAQPSRNVVRWMWSLTLRLAPEMQRGALAAPPRTQECQTCAMVPENSHQPERAIGPVSGGTLLSLRLREMPGQWLVASN